MSFNVLPRPETSRGGPSWRENQRFAREEAFVIDDEVSHLTRLRSEPSENYRRAMRAGRKMPISTFKMLSGREDNCSRTGRFSLADRAYILSQYLPVNGPRCVDDMDSEAYVAQFSADGSLFVAGFRVRHISVLDGKLFVIILFNGANLLVSSIDALGQPHQNIRCGERMGSAERC